MDRPAPGSAKATRGSDKPQRGSEKPARSTEKPLRPSEKASKRNSERAAKIAKSGMAASGKANAKPTGKGASAKGSAGGSSTAPGTAASTASQTLTPPPLPEDHPTPIHMAVEASLADPSVSRPRGLSGELGAGHLHAPVVLPPVPQTETQKQVASAINTAKIAAREAGFSPEVANSDHALIDMDDRPRVSYAFDLVGLENAPQISEIEEALEELPGVRARIVYPTATAWITAPEGTAPQDIVDIITTFGIDALLTDSSLRRRAMLAGRDDRSTRRAARRRTLNYRGLSWKFRRHLQEERKNLERARDAGWLRQPEDPDQDDPSTQADDGDVLFTARALLTPTRLIWCTVLSIPVLLLSYISAWQFPGWQWLCLALTTPVVIWGAWPFHRAMAGGMRRGLTALDAASSVAVIAAWLWSASLMMFTSSGEIGWTYVPHWFAIDRNRIADGEIFFDVACGMTVLLLAGRLITMRSRVSLISELDEWKPDPQSEVTVVQRNRSTGSPENVRIPLQEVNVGDDLFVEPGEMVPVDGQVIGGASTIVPGRVGRHDGPFDVKVNSHVWAGGMNTHQRLKIRVLRTGHRTRMAAVHRWVKDATRQQNRSEMLSTKSAAMLIPAALAVALIDFIIWALFGKNLNTAFCTALAVLACVAPVALALSPALAIRYGIETAARKGVLIRDGATIRQLDMVDTVVFNRVGTLAEPAMTVETVTADRGEEPELVLRVAGALAMESDHPVSRALVRASREARDAGTGGDLIPHWIEVSHSVIHTDGTFSGMIELPFADSDGTIHTRQVEASLWRPRNMARLRGRLAAAAVSGGSPLVVSWGGRDRGVITLHDDVRDDAIDAVSRLEDMGIDTMMLSRDTYPVARRFADRIGISRVLAGIAPGRKALTVRAVHTRGARVAMIGDNSVMECLRVADVGVLMGSTEPLDTMNQHEQHDPNVDVLVLRTDVSGIPALITLARRVCRIIDRNIWFSWAYNGLAVAASVAGVLHPMAATLLMLGSSLFIEMRSNQARKFDLHPVS